MKSIFTGRFQLMGLACLLLAWSMPCVADPEGLTIHYDMNAISGGYVANQVTTNFNGQVTGAEIEMGGACAGAARFDGTDRIDCGNILDVTATNRPALTVCAWVKTTDSVAAIVSKNQDASPYKGWALRLDPRPMADLVSSLSQRASALTTNRIDDNLWHMMVGVFTATTNSISSSLYIDGVLKGQATAVASSSPATTAGLRIGQRAPNGGEQYLGLVDEVRIFEAALDAGQIAQLYADEVSCFPAASAGSIAAVIQPSDVVSSGAMWRITSPTNFGWTASGSAVTGLTAGSYSVGYQAVDGWIAPASTTVVLQAGGAMVLTGRYLRVADPSGLLLHYDFEGTETNVVLDQTQSGRDGVVSGATFATNGLSGRGMYFDGNDYVDGGQILDLGGALTTITATVWFRTTDSVACLVGKNQDYTPYSGWSLRLDPRPMADLIAAYPRRADATSTNLLADGRWHQLAGIFVATPTSIHSTLYIDGWKAATKSYYANAGTATPAAWRLGMRSPGGGESFQGWMDEVRVYGRALADEEVLALYTNDAAALPASGAIVCSIEPAGAVLAGARWRPKSAGGDLWMGSGTALSCLQAGEYDIEFSEVAGWRAPSNAHVTVLSSSTTTVAVTYLPGPQTTNGLVLYYAFEDQDSAVTVDGSGSGYDGQLEGVTRTAGGRCGSGAEFSAGDRILVGPVLDLNASRTALTAAAWVRTTDSVFCVIGKNQDYSPYTGWSLRADPRPTADLVAAFPERVSAQCTTLVGDGEWHHLLGVYEVSGTELHSKLFIDGRLVGTASGTHAASTVTAAELVLGKRAPGGSETFEGTMDEVRVYDRALPSNEVWALYSEALPCDASLAHVHCTILPEAAAGAGAHWRIAGVNAGRWSDSGQSVTLRTGGVYTVEFASLEGWIAPIPTQVVAVVGETVDLVAEYVPAAPTTDGLYALYTFDTDGTNVAHDSSGLGHDAEIAGAKLSLVPGCGGIMQFDGNDHLSLGNVLDISGTATAITAVAWFRSATADKGSACLVGKNQDAWPYTGWSIRMDPRPTADLIATYPQRACAQWEVDLFDGGWHMMAGVFSRGSNVLSARVYVDGVRSETVSAWASTNPATAAALWIGQRAPGGGEGFKGSMDEVRIYRRALTESEVAALYDGHEECASAAGALLVNVLPAEASSAGARWRLTSGPYTDWQAGGALLQDLPSGTYTVTCSAVDSWLVPADEPVLVTAGETTIADRVYSSLASTTNNLVLWYPFSSPGAMAVDVSGSGHHGSIHGASWMTLEECGGALEFDGDDLVDVGPVLDLSGVTTALTAFVRIQGNPTVREMTLLGKNQDTWPYTGWSLRVNDYHVALVDLIASYPQRATSYITNDIFDGEWHVIAGQFLADGNRLLTRAYLDGVLVDENAWTGTAVSASTAARMAIGARFPRLSEPMQGLLDDVRIYDTLLDPAAIRTVASNMAVCAAMISRVGAVISPPEAREAGAMWTLVGSDTPALHDSGETISLPPGVHEIAFTDVPGWTTPLSVTVTSDAGGEVVATGAYVRAAADAVPPMFVKFAPPSGSVALEHDMVLNITVTDNVGIASVEVNGQPADRVTPWMYKMQLDGLRGLFNTLKVTATDVSGLSTSTNVLYAQAQELVLLSLWDGMWEVLNPFDALVAFDWRARNTAESGSGFVEPFSRVRFETTKGAKVVEILRNGVVVDFATSSGHSETGMVVEAFAYDDADDDGFSNLAEDIAGTDINDAASYPRLSLGSSGASFARLTLGSSSSTPGSVMSWPSEVGRLYTLQYSLDVTHWMKVQDFVDVEGTGGDLGYTNRFPDISVFFRMETQKAP